MGALLRGPSGLTYLDNTTLTIGRSRQNRLVYANNQISSKHAEIQPLGNGRFQVIDVGSSNGTRVNGIRLTPGEPRVLNAGDTLVLGGAGGVELLFEVEAAMISPDLAEPVYAGVSPAPAPLFQAPPPPDLPAGFPPAYQPNTSPDNWAAQGGFAYPQRDAAPHVMPAPAPLPRAITTTARRAPFSKPLLIVGSVLVLVLVIAGVALGARGLAGQASTPQATTAATPTNPPAPAVVQTARVNVQGEDKTVLTNAQGLTLYYFAPDTADKTACTGDCIAKWPPLLFQGSGDPTASTDLPGALSIQTSENGPQVAYNGHPLYTFSGDSAPGQANGQGKAGKWFVATPDLASQ